MLVRDIALWTGDVVLVGIVLVLSALFLVRLGGLSALVSGVPVVLGTLLLLLLL